MFGCFLTVRLAYKFNVRVYVRIFFQRVGHIVKSKLTNGTRFYEAITTLQNFGPIIACDNAACKTGASAM